MPLPDTTATTAATSASAAREDGLLQTGELRRIVSRLAAIPRESATAGERRAAEALAEELRRHGARVRLEDERAHGTYWWPIGILASVGLVATLRRSPLTALAAAGAALAAADDITGGRQWFRRLLSHRDATNVVAEVGEAAAPLTVVFVAHVDAAHAGLVFHPELPRAVGRRFPKLLERTNTTPPTMWGAVAGPALAAAGGLLGIRALRRAGGFLCAGYIAAMADIGARGVVPGANDNATGCAVLVSLASALEREPVAGVRTVLLATGSEESFMEGMQAFGRRHFANLPRERTVFVCLDTVGSPRLLVLEGEGMLRVRPYPRELRELILGCAGDLGIETARHLRFHNATDGLIPLVHGYRTAMIGSVDEFKTPTHYHWPTDVPENVHYGSVADAARLSLALLHRLGEREAGPRGNATGA
jgi:hypothetical protein